MGTAVYTSHKNTLVGDTRNRAKAKRTLPTFLIVVRPAGGGSRMRLTSAPSTARRGLKLLRPPQEVADATLLVRPWLQQFDQFGLEGQACQSGLALSCNGQRRPDTLDRVGEVLDRTV